MFLFSAYPSHFASVSTPNDTRSSLGWIVLHESLYFVTRTSNCCLYSQECGSGLATILDKRPWDSTASTFFCVAFTPEEGHNTLLQGWAKKGSSFLRCSSHWRDALFVSTRRFYYRCNFRELQSWRDLKVFHFCTSQPTVELVLVWLRR